MPANKLTERKPRVAAIIQARMGSTRLPGKVLLDIQGKPLLERVIERVKKSKLIDEIIIATTINAKDRAIIELARAQGLPYCAGSEEDVLDRYYQTAREFQADVIVRITSDNPLTDPEVIDRAVSYFLDNRDKSYYVYKTSRRPIRRVLMWKSFPSMLSRRRGRRQRSLRKGSM